MNVWTVGFPNFSEKHFKATEKKIRKPGSQTFIDGEARNPWGVGQETFPWTLPHIPCGHYCSPFQKLRTLAQDCRHSAFALGLTVPTYLEKYCLMYGLPWWLSHRESACNAEDTGDTGSIPGLGRFPGGRYGNPLQYSYLESPMDRGAWQATVYRVAQSRTQLKLLSMHVWCIQFVWPSVFNGLWVWVSGFANYSK